MNGLYGTSAPEPQVNVAAMAEIVKELLDGNQSQQQNSAWLQQRSRTAQLGEHEQAALEALRVRVCKRGAVMVGTSKDMVWW